MVVPVEKTLCRAELLHGLEKIVLALTAVDYLLALTGLAVDILDIIGILKAVSHVFVPRGALLRERNVEKGYGLDIRILGHTQLLETRVVLLVHKIYVVSVPLYLIVVDVVVLPHYSEVVAVGVGVAVEYVNRLSEQSLGVLNVYYLVAVAVNVVGSLLEQAVFEFRAAVKVGDLLAGVVAVDLGIVVAEGDRPIYAEPLHERGELLGGQEIIECACLEENRERHVARNDYEVGLLRLDHRGYRVERLRVLLEREPAAADMYVGQLHDLEVSVGGEGPVAVFVLFGHELILDYRGVIALCALDKRLVADNRYHNDGQHEQRENAEYRAYDDAGCFFLPGVFLLLFFHFFLLS